MYRVEERPLRERIGAILDGSFYAMEDDGAGANEEVALNWNTPGGFSGAFTGTASTATAQTPPAGLGRGRGRALVMPAWMQSSQTR